MNKIVEALRNGMVQKLIVGKIGTGVIAAKTGGYIAVPIDTNHLLLKSIEITCNKNTEFFVQFFEEAAMENSRYNSGTVTKECYDVLDLPFVDKDESYMMHMYIENTSDFDAEYAIEVRGIRMK